MGRGGACPVRADRVTVRVDERYGYPVRVDIDWHANAIDEEVCYEISELALYRT